jgi:superfamily II DNA/RNA helicase
MLLRKIFVPKGWRSKRRWRKLHNEGLRDLHSSLSIVRNAQQQTFNIPFNIQCAFIQEQLHGSALINRHQAISTMF